MHHFYLYLAYNQINNQSQSDHDMLDEKDVQILQLLQKDATINYSELAERVGLSVSSVHSRVKRLWYLGIIDKQTVLVNRKKLGFSILCFVHIALQAHSADDIAKFKQQIQTISEVLECHFVTGEFDTILKVVARDQEHLNSVLMEHLMPMRNVARMQTNIVLTEVKHTTALPISYSKNRKDSDESI